MMKTRLLTALPAAALCAGLALSGPAFAADSASGEGGEAKTEKRMDKMFERFDDDSDGRITIEEARTVYGNWFDEADANDDDALTQDEMSNASKAKVKEWRDTDELSSDKEQKVEKWSSKKFGKLDADSDGTVTKEEFTNAGVQMIEKADTNDDGAVTKEEGQAAVQKMKDKKDHKSDNSGGSGATGGAGESGGTGNMGTGQ